MEVHKKFLSPIKSIRQNCLDCMNGQTNEVRLCTSPKCNSFPYRQGVKPKVRHSSTPIQSIRQKCIDCRGGNLEQVRNCEHDGIQDNFCFLHPYRMGKSPNRACIGGNPNLKKSNSTNDSS